MFRADLLRARRLVTMRTSARWAFFERHRGVLLAALVVAATLAFQAFSYREDLQARAKFVMSGFDAWVYGAMAVEPTVFTLRPWGYRWLTPALAHIAGQGDFVRGFRVVTFGALWLGGVILFLLLRRLGYSERLSTLAVAFFGLSPPVGAAVSSLLLSEPVSLLLLVALLLAMESGAGAGALALLMALGVLSKESFLLYLPGFWLALPKGDRLRRGTLAVALALLATYGLRRVWAPYDDGTVGSVSSLWPWAAGAAAVTLQSWSRWWWSVLLWGLTPLAIGGALRREGRGFLRRYGVWLLTTLAVPFAAAVYTARPGQPMNFFGPDVPRLLLHALPFLLPLALTVFSRPSAVPADSALPRRSLVHDVAWGAAGLSVVLVPFVALDRYRRVDLQGPRDGPLVFALCSESVATARRLARGRAMQFAFPWQRYDPARFDPLDLRRMRWFLLDGWGHQPHYNVVEARMAGHTATILVPVMRPAPCEAVLKMSAPQEVVVKTAINGVPTSELGVGTEAARLRVTLPEAALFRGDNVLRLTLPDGSAPRPLLETLALRCEGGDPKPRPAR